MRKVIYLLPLLFSSVFLNAQVGTPVGTFGTGGIVTVPSPAVNERTAAMAIQQDGKLVVVGPANGGADNDFLVYRFNTNGTLDATFNGTGRVQTDLNAASDDVPFGVAIQSDGKIVVAGYSGNDFAVVRYTTTGGIDATFNGGVVITDIGTGTTDQGWAVAIQPADGKIVVSGTSNGGIALARYNTNGTLDNSFDTDGKVTTVVPTSTNNGAFSVAIQNDGKIVAAGFTALATYDFAVVRYNTDGSLDGSFNTTGIATVSLGGAFDVVAKVAIDNTGRIVLAGQTGAGFPGSDIALARLTAAGALDLTFGAGTGIVITDISGGGSVDQFNNMVLQADGKILVAGTTNASGNINMALARYTSAGILDVTFNAAGTPPGVAIIDAGAGNQDYGFAVVIEFTTIYFAGYTFAAANGDIALTAFVGDASSLPLNLLSFSAQKQSSSIQLNWQTEREQNILGFDIQRSSDGKTFKTLGYAAPITTTGVIKKNYSYVDNSPVNATNYYRLVIKDLDGSVTYSKIIAIKNNSNSQTMDVFPNPLPVGSGSLQIQLPAGLKGRTSLQISDALGRVVRSTIFETGGNSLATTVDVSTLTKGVYVIRAKSDNNVTLTTRFLKN